MDAWQLSLIDVTAAHHNQVSCILMTAEDGKLGFAGVQESKLLLWLRKAGPDGAVAWTQDRVIDLETLLPIRYHLEQFFCGLPTVTDVVGFADGVVFKHRGGFVHNSAQLRSSPEGIQKGLLQMSNHSLLELLHSRY